MPWFHYRALDADGVRFASTVEADTIYGAITAVSEMGLDLQAIEPVEDPAPWDAVDDPSPPSHHFEPLADRPPPAPREVPRGVSGVAGGLVFMLVGGLFTLIASIFIIVGVATVIAGVGPGWAFILFPMIHLTVGVGMLVYAIHGRAERRRVIADGEIALAKIATIGLDHKVRINGRSPFKMTYEFDVDGVTHRGKHSTMNEAITAHNLHDRIWVLYDPADPATNVEWPPL